LVALKLGVGLITGAVSVLAEALHSAADLLAALMVLFSVRTAEQPADSRHHFGHGKFESVSGTLEGLIIFAAAAGIFYKAGVGLSQRSGPRAVELGIGVMGVSALVNLFVSRRLRQVARATDSVALRADAVQLGIDVWSSLAVLGALLAEKLYPAGLADPVLGIGVGLYVMYEGVALMRSAFGELVDAALPPAEQQLLEELLKRHTPMGFTFHDLRSRKVGRHRYVELHLEVAAALSVEQAHQVCDHLEAEIEALFPDSRVMIHTEPAAANQPAQRASSGSASPKAGRQR